MGTYTKIPQDTFDALQLDAGVLLSTFDPANPSFSESDIITATTGGIQISATSTFSDLGEDVDNCPTNTKELKHLDSWEISVSTTALGTSADLIKMALGCAETTGATYALTSDQAIVTGKTYYTRSGTSPNYVYTPVASPSAASLSTYYEMTSPDYKITPRRDLDQNDFNDLWWVGDKADGGFVAAKLMNALSTGGFALQTSKNSKGQTSLTITCHPSINAQDVVPVEFYSVNGASD